MERSDNELGNTYAESTSSGALILLLGAILTESGQ